MIDLADAYTETHDHLVDLVGGLPEEMLGRTVAATPAWDVRDAVAHVTAEAYIATTGDAPPDLNLLESLRSQEMADRRDALNAQHIEARRDRPLQAVLDEWAGLVEQVLPMMRGERPFPFAHPFIDNILVADLAMHAQDIRSTVGAPGDRDSAGVGVALGAFTFGLDFRLNALGLPGLRVGYGQKERILGPEPVGATMATDRFELVRALTGRRSSAQIRAYDWEGDPEPYVPIIPAYGPRDDDIID
jgi:uncharacterized protein (TIGR03083 family)